MKTQEELERMSDHELNLALHFIIDESFKSTYRLAWTIQGVVSDLVIKAHQRECRK